MEFAIMTCCSILLLIALLLILSLVDIQCCISWLFSHLPTLKANLIYLESIISQYSGLLFIFLIIAFFLYILAKFKPSLSEFSFAGITFSLREPDVKKDVRLFLNTKRSLFQFIEGYDNLYDVIRSWYEILKFLRDKISNLEERAGGLSGGEVAEVGKKCEELLLELNTFLTKYQSDYKRWYEQEIASQTGAQATGQTATFRPFDQIQRSYSLYSNMIADIKRINAIMQEEFVPYFGINAKKWIKVKNRLTNGGIQRRMTQHMHKYI